MEKIGACEDAVQTARGSRGILSGLVAAIGSVWASRKPAKANLHQIRLVSWAGRANTDAWFILQLEQSKNRALYHYTRSQTR